MTQEHHLKSWILWIKENSQKLQKLKPTRFLCHILWYMSDKLNLGTFLCSITSSWANHQYSTLFPRPKNRYKLRSNQTDETFMCYGTDESSGLSIPE